jgi:hypothetical protein
VEIISETTTWKDGIHLLDCQLGLLEALLFYSAGLELSWAWMQLCMLTPPSSAHPHTNIKAVILDTLQSRSVITEEILETSWHLFLPLYLSTH